VESEAKQRSADGRHSAIERLAGAGFAGAVAFPRARELPRLRDVKVRYKQTALGVALVLLQPLLAMGIFSIGAGAVVLLLERDQRRRWQQRRRQYAADQQGVPPAPGDSRWRWC
jgi:hypothetical protein